MVNLEAGTVLNGDAPRDVFEDSHVFLVVVDVLAVGEQASLHVLFLAEDAHDVVEYAWLELLFLEESSDDYGFLEGLDVQDVVDESGLGFE